MKKELDKLKRNNGNRMVVTYTIPIIFHIIHNGQAVGATQNVSATYINAQISQMNIDFANLKAIPDTFYTIEYTSRSLSRYSIRQSNGGSYSIVFGSY